MTDGFRTGATMSYMQTKSSTGQGVNWVHKRETGRLIMRLIQGTDVQWQSGQYGFNAIKTKDNTKRRHPFYDESLCSSKLFISRSSSDWEDRCCPFNRMRQRTGPRPKVVKWIKLFPLKWSKVWIPVPLSLWWYIATPCRPARYDF